MHRGESSILASSLCASSRPPRVLRTSEQNNLECTSALLMREVGGIVQCNTEVSRRGSRVSLIADGSVMYSTDLLTPQVLPPGTVHKLEVYAGTVH